MEGLAGEHVCVQLDNVVLAIMAEQERVEDLRQQLHRTLSDVRVSAGMCVCARVCHLIRPVAHSTRASFHLPKPD